MHPEMTGDLLLCVTVFLNCLFDSLISGPFVLNDFPVKELFEPGPTQVSLPLRYLENIFMAFGIIHESLNEVITSKNALGLHSLPERFCVHPCPHKISVTSLRYSPLTPKLTQYPVRSKAPLSLFSACRGPIATPFPLLRLLNYSCSYRIKDNITTGLKKMIILLDQNGLEPPLKQMSNPLMFSIECLSVDPVQLPHPD